MDTVKFLKSLSVEMVSIECDRLKGKIRNIVKRLICTTNDFNVLQNYRYEITQIQTHLYIRQWVILKI